MSGARLLWPRPLADVPGFPAELVAGLATHQIRTVGDLVARVKRLNPGMTPPATVLGLHIWQTPFALADRAPAIRAGAILAEYLGYGEYERPSQWTDPPASASRSQPTPEPTMSTPRIDLVKPQSLQLHADAGEVLMMSADQYQEFLSAVKRDGIIREALKRLKGTTTIIDGRHRRQAAIDAGFAVVPVIDVELGDEDPVLYMLSSAVHRRHFTPGQRAAQGAKYLDRLKKLAKERQKQGGKKGGETAGRGRAKEPDRLVADPPQPKPEPAPKSRDEAARLSGSSPKAVTAAEKVQQKSPEVFAQLSAGQITLPAAKKAITEPKPVEKAPSAKGAIDICATLHELNPCPFCGAVGTHLAMFGGHNITCHNCGAMGPNQSNQNAARAAWNKRAKK